MPEYKKYVKNNLHLVCLYTHNSMYTYACMYAILMLLRIMTPISYSACAIQNLLLLAWISASSYDDILYTIQITDKSYYILNSQNQVKFYTYVDKTGFPSPSHIIYIDQYLSDLIFGKAAHNS